MVEKVARATRPAEQRQERRLFLLPPRVPAARTLMPGRTIRTSKERSRGGRSPRAKQAGSFRRPKTRRPLQSKSFVACVGKVQLNAAEWREARWASWAGPRAPRQSRSRCAGTSMLQQPALVQVIGTAVLRHNCTAQRRRLASPRRAAAEAQRPARRRHAARTTPRHRAVVARATVASDSGHRHSH